MPVVEPDRRARMAAVGDVGVELAGPGAEALRRRRVVEDDSPVGDEQRARLQQVAAGALGQLAARARSRTPPVDGVERRAARMVLGRERRAGTAAPPTRTSPSGRNGSRR